jgi:hypothetical protein
VRINNYLFYCHPTIFPTDYTLRVTPTLSCILEIGNTYLQAMRFTGVYLHDPVFWNQSYLFYYTNQYCDWLLAGRPRGRSSSPGRVKNFLFSKSYRPALGSTQPPIQWVPRALSPGVKRPYREADHSPS